MMDVITKRISFCQEVKPVSIVTGLSYFLPLYTTRVLTLSSGDVVIVATYNVTLRHVCLTSVAVGKPQVLHILSVSVCTIFSTLSHK